MVINEAPDKLVPVWCMGSFADQTLKGSKIVDCNFGHISKELLEILDNVIFVVQEGAPHKAGVITACTEHALRWSVVGSMHHISNEIHLTRCNHIVYARYVVGHTPNMLIANVFLFDSCHQQS
jgi:hypothetical protein